MTKRRRLLMVRRTVRRDPLLRDKIQADLDDMQHLVQALSLDFLRGGDHAEPMVLTDVDALLESLQEDVEDTGFSLAIQGATAPLRCRPLALKRCLAIWWITRCTTAAMSGSWCARCPERLTLRVCDRGPGIPEAQLEQVFAPFYRLELPAQPRYRRYRFWPEHCPGDCPRPRR